MKKNDLNSNLIVQIVLAIANKQFSNTVTVTFENV